MLSVESAQDLEIIDQLQRREHPPAILVTADSADEVLATEIIRRGAQDFTPTKELSQVELEYLIDASLARHEYKQQQRAPSDIQHHRRTGIPAPHAERRLHKRYNVTKNVFAVPVLPDSGPAQSHSAEGFSVDVSEGGMLFEIRGINRLPTRHLLVGIEGDRGELHFATVEVMRQEEIASGLRIGAQFTTEVRDVIRESNLCPTFDPVTSKFTTGLPQAVLDGGSSLGSSVRYSLTECSFARSVVACRRFDEAAVCAVPCGSVRVASPQLIHHFACANVGYVEEYQVDDRIICPKCRSQDLMVGADFEYLNGPYTCLDCNWQDNELESVGKCLGCKTLFPAHQAVEEELIGYHVNRLDPLVLIHSV